MGLVVYLACGVAVEDSSTLTKKWFMNMETNPVKYRLILDNIKTAVTNELQEFLVHYLQREMVTSRDSAPTWRPRFAYTNTVLPNKIRLICEQRPGRRYLRFSPSKYGGNNYSTYSVPQPWVYLAENIITGLTISSVKTEGTTLKGKISIKIGIEGSLSCVWSKRSLVKIGQAAYVPDFPNINVVMGHVCMPYNQSMKRIDCYVTYDKNTEETTIVWDFTRLKSPGNPASGKYPQSLLSILTQHIKKFNESVFNSGLCGGTSIKPDTLRTFGVENRFLTRSHSKGLSQFNKRFETFANITQVQLMKNMPSGTRSNTIGFWQQDTQGAYNNTRKVYNIRHLGNPSPNVAAMLEQYKGAT